MALKLSDFQEGEVKEVEKSKTRGGLLQTAKNIAGGFLEETGRIGRNVQDILPRGLGTVPNFSTGGMGSKASESSRAERLASVGAEEGTGANVGAGISTIAQFLAPTGAISRGQQVLGAAAQKVPTLLGRTGAKAAARFLPEAAGTGSVSLLRSGDIEQAKDEGALAGAFSVGLGALGGLARATYWPTLDDSVSKALGSQGKKSGGTALRQTAEKVTGLKVLKDRAKDLTVTLDDGSKAVFNPDNASYNTTLQAWNEARKKIYSEYTSLAEKAGQKAVVSLDNVRQQIAEALDAPILSTEKNAVRSILKDFDEVFKDPTNVDIKTAERFVQSLNDNTVSGFFAGTSDAASSKVNAGTARLIREIMDEAITESEGVGYQALRTQYAALKSIEDDLVRRFQQDARSIGGGLPEYTGAFASGDIIGSALSLDPAQFAKGATLGVFSALKRKLSNPERFLRRSFDLIDDVPSDLGLRIWGGSRPLTAGEQKAASEVVESAQNPAAGLSIRSTVTPASVGKELTENEFDVIVRNIDDVQLGKTSDPDFNAVLDKYGLTNAQPVELQRFLREVTDEFELPGSTQKQSFNQSATTKTTDLLEEARKYPNAKYNSITMRDKAPDIAEAMFAMPEEKIVYRGEGKGIGNSTLVKGRYFADSKEFAETFGDVTEDVIPKNAVVFDFDIVKSNPNQKLIPSNILVDQDALTDYLIERGVQYTKNTNTRGVEFVKLNKSQSLLNSKAKTMSLDEFKTHVMQNYNQYREELARISKNYTQADRSRRRSPIEDIWKQANE